jgi:hypothetical protein
MRAADGERQLQSAPHSDYRNPRLLGGSHSSGSITPAAPDEIRVDKPKKDEAVYVCQPTTDLHLQNISRAWVNGLSTLGRGSRIKDQGSDGYIYTI